MIFLIMMMNCQMAGVWCIWKCQDDADFGKSHNKSSPDDNKKVTFDKVAGLQEEKEDFGRGGRDF